MHYGSGPGKRKTGAIGTGMDKHDLYENRLLGQ